MNAVSEVKERLRIAARFMASVESVGAMVSVADLALILASHDALEESVARLSRERQPRIDAARLEGIRLGLEAAAKAALLNSHAEPFDLKYIDAVWSSIRTLDPETIAKEADR